LAPKPPVILIELYQTTEAQTTC